jgi:hypothetical protein
MLEKKLQSTQTPTANFDPQIYIFGQNQNTYTHVFVHPPSQKNQLYDTPSSEMLVLQPFQWILFEF